MRPPPPAPGSDKAEVTHIGRGLASWWLLTTAGEGLRISERGLLIGRAPTCDLVLRDRAASARQAMVLHAGEDLEVLALGRNPTLVNDTPVTGRAVLRPGDHLAVPGAELRVERLGRPEVIRGRWMLSSGTGLFGLRLLPLSIGGSVGDDVRIDGWPPAALILKLDDGLLVFEAGVPLLHGGRAVPEGATEVAGPGDSFTVAGRTLVLRRDAGADPAGTELMEVSGRPIRVRFEFLARGGRLELDYGMGPPLSVLLPELRARLVAALLQPPRGYAPGEYLPDEIVIPAVWSGNATRTRTDLNVLLHHTRKALQKAGIQPATVLSRARTGGSTCFLLAVDARVEVC